MSRKTFNDIDNEQKTWREATKTHPINKMKINLKLNTFTYSL